MYIINPVNIGNIILGIFGLLSTIFILRIFNIVKKKTEIRPEEINLVTAIGFFNGFLFYHLLMSFSETSDSVSSVIIEFFLLIVGLFYIVQSMTKRIIKAPESTEKLTDHVEFQSKLRFTSKLKNIWGESGIVLIVLGCAMGYHMIFLETFITIDFPILSIFATAGVNINAVFHRIYLIFSFCIIYIAWFSFMKSNDFQYFMKDKYTRDNLSKFIDAYFQKPSENLPSQFEYEFFELSKRIGEKISTKIGNGIESSLKNLGDLLRIFQGKKKSEENEES